MPTWPAQAGTTALREEQMTVPGEGMPTGHRMGPCRRGSADNLQDVTLVGNDTGGALVQLLMCHRDARVGRVVLASCDAFDNFPPGLTGKTLVLAGKLPPAMFGLFMQQMRLRAVRRLPIAFGWLTIRGDAATARWMKPVLTQPEIRRDAVRVLRAAAKEPKLLREAAGCLPGFNRPALVVWASEDRVMPPEHGQRLAKLLPQGQLAEIEDSYTLIPLDQPARLAQLIREFTHGPGTLRRGQNGRSEHVEDRDRDRRESGAGAGPCARAVPHAGNRRHRLPDGA